MNDEITPSWPMRIWHAFERFCSDNACLLEPNKFFIYSWMEYRGQECLIITGGIVCPENYGDSVLQL